MSEDEGFLQRWSRRKQGIDRDDEEPNAADHEQAAPSAEDPVDGPDEALAADSEAEPEPEPPGDEDMPPLESIDEGGSVAAFFSPRVSEGLRQAALRRLFRQPKYNVVDILDDYAEDYSKPVAMGNILTADMRYQAEQARKRLEARLKEGLAEKEDGAEEPADEPQTVASTADSETTTHDEDVADTGESLAQAEDSDEAVRDASEDEDSESDSRQV